MGYETMDRWLYREIQVIQDDDESLSTLFEPSTEFSESIGSGECKGKNKSFSMNDVYATRKKANSQNRLQCKSSALLSSKKKGANSKIADANASISRKAPLRMASFDDLSANSKNTKSTKSRANGRPRFPFRRESLEENDSKVNEKKIRFRNPLRRNPSFDNDLDYVVNGELNPPVRPSRRSSSELKPAPTSTNPISKQTKNSKSNAQKGSLDDASTKDFSSSHSSDVTNEENQLRGGHERNPSLSLRTKPTMTKHPSFRGLHGISTNERNPPNKPKRRSSSPSRSYCEQNCNKLDERNQQISNFKLKDPSATDLNNGVFRSDTA